MNILECSMKENGDFVMPISFSREDREKRKDSVYRENQNKTILKEINKTLAAVSKYML